MTGRVSLASQQAADWFVRQDAGPLSPDEEQEFRAWRSVPANARAFERLNGMWGDFDRAVEAGTRPVVPERAKPKRARALTRWVAVAMAAAFVGVLVVPALWISLQADHSTRVGEIRTIRLSDGSTITLNTDSAVALDFNATSRTVRLLAGEAEFSVTRDAGRPFIVEAARGRTRALGTVFAVRLQDSGARVTGLHHSVEVTSSAVAGGRAIVNAGQQVHYDSAGGVGTVLSAAPEADAWRRGRLIVEGRPLAEVVDELNRYHRGRIQLVGEGLGALRVNGVFPVADPEACIVALEESLGVRATRITGHFILLTR